MSQGPKTYSISEIVRDIKSQLEGEYFNITIQGEVINFSGSSAGHYYFTLADDEAQISCALFKGDALRNPLVRKIKDGDKIMASGSVSVYLKRGTFQLIAKKISYFGKGDLKAQYEALKLKLSQQGFFDIAHKKAIPKFPAKIAIITAPGGAALQDFLNIMKRRSYGFHITIIPALMQGDGCASSVIKALKHAQQLAGVEVVLITRGGGAMEDLWGFNDESLVKLIYECPLPVISAIGHQIDYTLCDYVSDLRCETPSSAAEVLSQEQVHVKKHLRGLGRTLRSHALDVKSKLNNMIMKLNPKYSIDHLKEMLSQYKYRLKISAPHQLIDPVGLNQSRQELDYLLERLFRAQEKKIQKYQEKLKLSNSVLESLSPFKVLARGYSIVTNDQNQVLTSSEDFDKLKAGATLKIQFKDDQRQVIKKE